MSARCTTRFSRHFAAAARPKCPAITACVAWDQAMGVRHLTHADDNDE